MSKRISVALGAVALFVGAASLAAQDVKLKEEKPGLLKRAKVTFEQAKATAQAKLPGARLESAELEEEDGKLIYTLVYKTAGKKGVDEVNVDAITGKVAATEHETPEEEKKDAKKVVTKKP